MAQTGMTGWRGKHAVEGCDDVVSSLELLDKVLSEFDEQPLDGNGNVAGASTNAVVSVGAGTDAESPSLGHQSEDDGYMSMNGRRAKIAAMRSAEYTADLPPPEAPALVGDDEPMADFPPPPEEAERVIAHLLPRVSPGNSLIGKQGLMRPCSRKLFTEPIHNGDCSLSSTQTTLPNMRQPRPFWENANGENAQENGRPFHLIQPRKFASLPYENAQHAQRIPPTWSYRSGPLPPRTVAHAMDKHREVRRDSPAESRRPPRGVDSVDIGNFSDDSLDGDAVGSVGRQRGSIAWEVSLDDHSMSPGCTKVVGGRRRRKSNEMSSNGSLNQTNDTTETWPAPPPNLDLPYASDAPSPLLPLDLTFNGTYVIRKGRNRERPPLYPHKNMPPRQTSLDSSKRRNNANELKRTSSTFDNIKQYLREGLIEGLDDPPPEFPPPPAPVLVRVVSLPALPVGDGDSMASSDEGIFSRTPKSNERYSKVVPELGVTLEEAEDDFSSLDNPSLNSAINGFDAKPLPAEPAMRAREVETQTDLSDVETQTELELVGKQIREISKTKSELEEVEKKIQEIVKIKTTLEKERENDDPWVPRNDICQKSDSTGDFNVKVQVLEHHDFRPLPPTPPDDYFDDYTEIPHHHRGPPHSQPTRRKADTLPEPLPPQSSSQQRVNNYHSHHHYQQQRNRSGECSLKTRSMDAGFSKSGGSKVFCNGAGSASRRELGSERRTLPTDLLPPASSSLSSRRRMLHKRPSAGTSPQDGVPPSASTTASCSLPETPIFARGCDIPRTPHRTHQPDNGVASSGNGCTPRGGTANVAASSNTQTVSSINAGGTGGEALRLAGGPARGWYPRQRQPRPASSEHLDRLPLPHAWDSASRKPMTLPPNVTPAFFHRSPRDALRRVTSLLIRGGGGGKGSSTKDAKTKDFLPANTSFGDDAVESGGKQKRGFFRWWKKSRRYSLDPQ